MYTIIFQNRILLTSHSENIYQNNNRTDYIKILINSEELGVDPQLFDVIVQAILPDGKAGRLGYLVCEPDLYKEKYIIGFFPVTRTLTIQDGPVSVNLYLIKHDLETDTYYSLNTNTIKIMIQSASSMEDSLASGEEADLLTQISQRLATVEEGKIGAIHYNSDTNELILYNDESQSVILSSIKLKDDIIWDTL